MAKVMVMPKMGLTMTEGTINKWMKAEGQAVEKGDILLEVSTDKLTNDVEAAESGILRRILAQEGDVVACFGSICVIAGADEDIADLDFGTSGGEETEPIKQVKEDAVTADEPAKKSERVKASPKAKKKAKELGVDIAKVIGSGPQGRITVEDVEAYREKGDQVKASPTAKKVADNLDVELGDINRQGRIMKQDVLDHSAARELLQKANPQDTREPMSRMRQVIAKRMADNWATIPAVTFDMKVDMTEVLALKTKLKEVHKVTITDLLVKMTSQALLDFPLLNATLDGKDIITRNYTNIGIAVAIEDGLMVPVVKYANVKGLKEISEEIKSLAKQAKNQTIALEALQGGTFTITNLGMFGINAFSPIINAPEVAILGVNAIEDVLSLVNGEVVSKPMMTLSLTADHRVVDGAVAANFMKRLKMLVEHPEMLML